MNPPASAKNNSIVVSIKPLHSLVSGLTQGISQPHLLLHAGQSPHDYQMRPSERRLIQQASLIIIASPEIESFISNIKPESSNQQLIALSAIPGIKTLPARTLDHGHDHGQQSHGNIDGHLWLSIDNAIIFLQHLGQVLAEQDPANGSRYIQNRERLVTQLRELKQALEIQLKPVRDEAFITFHDAFQYFETEFNLHHSLFVTINPEQKPGIRQIHYLKQQIQQQQIQCIFYEPPHVPRIISTLSEDQTMQVLPLDPLGNDLNPGTELYSQLMTNTAKQLVHCLTKSAN